MRRFDESFIAWICSSTSGHCDWAAMNLASNQLDKPMRLSMHHGTAKEAGASAHLHFTERLIALSLRLGHLSQGHGERRDGGKTSAPCGRENAALGGRACITRSHVMTLLEKLYILQCAERLALGFPTGLFISYIIGYIPNYPHSYLYTIQNFLALRHADS